MTLPIGKEAISGKNTILNFNYYLTDHVCTLVITTYYFFFAFFLPLASLVLES